MRTIEEKPIKLKVVRTRRGALLYMIEVDKNHFYLEQNPLKNSKYGVAYRKIKERFPEFYMFWEIKNNRYTGKLLVGAILEKQEIDDFITLVAQSDEFMNFEHILDEIEEMEEEKGE